VGAWPFAQQKRHETLPLFAFCWQYPARVADALLVVCQAFASGAQGGDIQVSLQWNTIDDLDLHVVTNQSTKNGVQKRTEFTATSATMQPPPPLRWRLWARQGSSRPCFGETCLLSCLAFAGRTGRVFGDRFNGDTEVENAARRRWTMPQTPRGRWTKPQNPTTHTLLLHTASPGPPWWDGPASNDLVLLLALSSHAAVAKLF
jgi:hypothetical protein